MTPNQFGQRGPDVGFAERLLEVIDSGRRTATYKLALLMALLDLCARHSDADGRAPRLLYTRDIALTRRAQPGAAPWLWRSRRT